MKPYLLIKTRWGFSPSFIADFVAAYYVVISSYATHWHIISLDSSKLKLTQKLPRGKQWKSAIRLVGMRRWLEEGLRLAGIDEHVKLGMFHKFSSQLVKQQASLADLRILDLWVRPPDHIDMVLAGRDVLGIAYVSQKAEVLAEKLKWKERSSDAIGNRLFDIRNYLYCKLLSATKYEYIPKMRVPSRCFDIYVSSQAFSYKEVKALFSSQTTSEDVSRSFVVRGTDLTFEHFGFDENLEDPKALSSLVLYTVEFGKFLRQVYDPNLEVRKQRFVVQDFEDKEWSYIAYEPEVRLLKPGDYIAILAKRVWCQDQTFCLKRWLLTEGEYQQAKNIVVNNESNFRATYRTISLDDLERSFSATVEERAIRELPSGLEIYHLHHGRGIIIGRTAIEGCDMVKVEFVQKGLTDYIPANTPVSVSWAGGRILT